MRNQLKLFSGFSLDLNYSDLQKNYEHGDVVNLLTGSVKIKQ